MRRLHLLDSPVPDVGTALEYHGYIQIDPINVCGRMHDLILRNRVRDYREGDLMRYLHGEEGSSLPPGKRKALEHHLPSTHILVAFPAKAWPYLHLAMKQRERASGPWLGRLTPRERSFAKDLLSELKVRAPLSSDDLDDGRRHAHTWGRSTLAKVVLQKLFFHGRILIAARKSQRRYYALPEQVLPASTFKAKRPDKGEYARWMVLSRLRQHRLVRLKKSEIPLMEDMVHLLKIENGLQLYCLNEDVPLLESRALGGGDARIRLLPPLDPLIYDRQVTSKLWDFDYTWEAYTPLHKRVRGYYALPLLSRLEFVGHIDPKMDRKLGRLLIQNKSIRRGFSPTQSIQELTYFLNTPQGGNQV